MNGDPNLMIATPDAARSTDRARHRCLRAPKSPISDAMADEPALTPSSLASPIFRTHRTVQSYPTIPNGHVPYAPPTVLLTHRRSRRRQPRLCNRPPMSKDPIVHVLTSMLRPLNVPAQAYNWTNLPEMMNFLPYANLQYESALVPPRKLRTISTRQLASLRRDGWRIVYSTEPTALELLWMTRSLTMRTFKVYCPKIPPPAKWGWIHYRLHWPLLEPHWPLNANSE